MKKIKRRVVGILLSIMMALQLCNVFAVELVDGIPSEVKKADGGYKQVPVYFNGAEVTEFNVFLRKYNDTAQNANERFDISGTATFRVRSYAYKTGSDVKVGTYIECLGTDGEWFEMNWRDREDQISSGDADAYLKGEKDLSVTIKDIQFTMPNQNDTDLRVTFYMKTSTGGEFSRPTEKNIQFSTIGKVGITRTVTEVKDEKNVWEVAVKLEGQVKPQVPSTDVVLVLDRSGSMNDKAKQLKCTKQEHTHADTCYTISSTPLCGYSSSRWHKHTDSCYQKLVCSVSAHTHGDTCYTTTNMTRASLVNDASQSLVTSLVEQPNVRVSVVSFGGTETKPSGNGYEHFDDNWNSIYQKLANGGWYSNFKVESDFTNDASTLESAVSVAMNNINGGTPMSIGIIKAGLMLKESEADNQVIILLSDGDPTYMRNGDGAGNRSDSSWNTKIDKDTVSAANEAKSKVENLTVFTIAAGSGISQDGKNVLEQCATNATEYAYQADDSEAALKGVMDKIAAAVKKDVASSTTLSETLADNIELQLPTTDISKAVTKIGFKDASKGITNDVDWSKTGIAITQGDMKKLEDGSMVWDIGELTTDAPAIIKYRIYLASGLLGEKYNISKEASFNYVDTNGKTITNAIPNASIKFSWAKINVSTYDYSVMKVVPGSQFTIWSEVPDDFKVGDIVFDYNMRFNTSNLEVSETGNKTVEENILVPTGTDGQPATIVGVLVDGKMYSVEEMKGISETSDSGSVEVRGAALKQSPTDSKNLTNEPNVSSVTNESNNFIQPQGVSNISANVKFNVKSKDVSYTVDISKLLDAQLGGATLMNYDLSKLSVQVNKVNESNKVLVKGTDYTVERPSGSEIKVNFKDVVNVNDEYKIAFYIPSTMNTAVVYGGAGEQTYLNLYNKKTVQIDNVIVATPKVEDILLESGVINEVYGAPIPTSSVIKPENKITLTYIEIAKIN